MRRVILVGMILFTICSFGAEQEGVRFRFLEDELIYYVERPCLIGAVAWAETNAPHAYAFFNLSRRVFEFDRDLKSGTRQFDSSWLTGRWKYKIPRNMLEEMFVRSSDVSESEAVRNAARMALEASYDSLINDCIESKVSIYEYFEEGL